MDELRVGAVRDIESQTDDSIFVSRQPIYTRSVELHAYELLYQQSVIDQASMKNGDKAGAEILLNAFLNVGLDTLVGETIAFIRIPSSFILQDYCKALPKERVVLLIAPIESDTSVIRAVTELVGAGHSIALDDYRNQNHPLLELSTYVSLSLDCHTSDELSKRLSLLKHVKVKTVARDVKNYADVEIAKELGFDYLSGSFSDKPKLKTPTSVPLNRLSTLQLALKLQEPELSTAELTRIVSQDLAISYKLLSYLNSAALSFSKKIESIKHAIQMVGTDRIRAWVSVLLLSKLEDKPTELITTSFVRAKMAEGLALALNRSNPDSYYLVGLFSSIDAMLNVPMCEATGLLPFSSQVREALLNHEGEMGAVLRLVLAYETGNWSDVLSDQLSAGTIRQCYLDAISSAKKLPTGSIRS